MARRPSKGMSDGAILEGMSKLAFGLLACLCASPVAAQRMESAPGAKTGACCSQASQAPGSPAAATVFIRVIGQVRVEYRKAWEESIERREVELGTGSGFVISPYGHVLTNYHVISDRELTRQEGDTEVTIKVEVERVEVVFPGGPSGPDADGARRFTASIDAVDPALDLAVLSINGVDVTYVPFGDSTAIEPNDPVQVLGYPFGREVEVAKVKIPDIVPRVSASKGTVSALRADEGGRGRYIQTNATMNPGNSGGPLVDKEGYVLGVVRMKLAEAEDVGFAVSIDVVKDFLESHGLDSLLPAQRLRLGPAQGLDGKGLRLRLPQRLEDVAPQRLLADSGQSLEGVRFRLDRVFSPWSVSDLAELLLSGQAFETFSAGSAGRDPVRKSSEGVEYGEATGRVPNRGGAWKMVYAVLEVGEKEKLVARYLGDAEQVAFNRGALLRSLASMEAERLLVDEVRAAPHVEWEAASLPGARWSGLAHVTMPTDWILEPGTPFPCPGAPPLEAALAASPPGDFTVSLRAAWWPTRKATPETAASSCSNRRGSLGETSYTFGEDWLGIRYTVQGSFMSVGEGLLQLEVVAPAEKAGYLTGLFAAWVRENTR